MLALLLSFLCLAQRHLQDFKQGFDFLTFALPASSTYEKAICFQRSVFSAFRLEVFFFDLETGSLYIWPLVTPASRNHKENLKVCGIQEKLTLRMLTCLRKYTRADSGCSFFLLEFCAPFFLTGRKSAILLSFCIFFFF